MIEYNINKPKFQKVIGKIRAGLIMENPKAKYPKAMLTSQQAAKGTATVNCGGEWASAQFSFDLANRVMADERFQAFLKEENASAAIQQYSVGNHAAYQVRIRFQGKEV